MKSEDKPCKIIADRFDKRIESCEQKRSNSLKWMNKFKFCRVSASVLSVLFVSLLAAEGFEKDTKFYFNIIAIVCTAITAFNSTILSEFGFENRFKQNVKALGKLQSLKSNFELAVSSAEEISAKECMQWNSKIDEILGDQAAIFDEEYTKAIQSK